jgi:hypothetical protein
MIAPDLSIANQTTQRLYQLYETLSKNTYYHDFIGFFIVGTFSIPKKQCSINTTLFKLNIDLNNIYTDD